MSFKFRWVLVIIEKYYAMQLTISPTTSNVSFCPVPSIKAKMCNVSGFLLLSFCTQILIYVTQASCDNTQNMEQTKQEITFTFYIPF